MIIEQYIEIAEKKYEIDGISLVNTEVLENLSRTAPEGYYRVIRWSFSDGTVIRFEDDADTETSWKSRHRTWKFEVKGNQVSQESRNEVVDKF